MQMDSLLYTDNAHKDIWLKLVLAVPLAIILGTVFYSLAINDTEAAVETLGVAVLVLIIFWIIFPRKYIIYDNKLKIVLGGPFSFNVPFHTIKTAEPLKGTSFGVNFPSSLSSKHIVEIIRNRRMNVTITPSNRELFLENLDKAMADWKKYQNRGAL